MTVQQHRHRLVAILSADAPGCSQLMAVYESATLLAIDAAGIVFRQQSEAHRGPVVDTTGDSALAVFETAAGAMSSALAIQRQPDASAAAEPEHGRKRFPIGVHLGKTFGRQHPAWREPGRCSCRAAVPLRVRHQPQGGARNQPYPAVVALVRADGVE